MSRPGEAPARVPEPPAGFQQWERAMDELRELTRQYSRARESGNRELMFRLRGRLHWHTLRCDLLLASAVAAERGARPRVPR